MTIFVLALVVSISGQDGGTLCERYSARRTAAMQAAATSADIDRVVELLAEDAVYEHPAVGVRIAGREAIRKGMASQLRRTRDAHSEIVSRTGVRLVCAVTEQLSFEAQQGSTWTGVKRTQLLVIESKDGTIARILEYWDR